MQAAATDIFTRPTPALSALSGAGAGSAVGPHFSELINPRDAATDRVAETDGQKVHQAAVQLVSSTMIKPMLDRVRHDPMRSKLFRGGPAMDMFGAQLDQALADRVTSRAGFSLVGAVERSIAGRISRMGAPAASRLDVKA